MKKRDVVIGFVVLVVLILGALWIRNRKNKSALEVTSPTIEEKMESTFPNLQIPEGVEKASLSDITGGSAMGIATRDTVLADLPDPETGYFYQVWTEKDGVLLSLGKMRIAKGGYLFEGDVTGQKVIVSLEKNFDGTLETKILEGSF